MPDRYFTIKERTDSIINPVSLQIAEVIIKNLDLGYIFKRDDITVVSDDLKDTSSSESGHVRISDNRCRVLISPVHDPKQVVQDVNNFFNIKAHGVYNQKFENEIPLFKDEIYNIKMWEYGKPCNLRFEFIMLFREKDHALKAMTALTNMYHGSGKMNIHDLYFTYPLSIEELNCLYELYKLRPAYDNKGFVGWLHDHTRKEIGMESSGNEHRLIIKTIQMNALASIDFGQEKPEASLSPSGQMTDRWEIRFNYVLQFKVPDTLRIYFPTTINNQFIPKRLVSSKQPENYIFSKNLEGIMQNLSLHKALLGNHVYIKDPIRLPFYEDFYPFSMTPQKTYGYLPLLISSMTLEKKENHWEETVDILNIPGVTFDPVVKTLLLEHDINDFFQTGGLFNIVFYTNEIPYDEKPEIIKMNNSIRIKISTMSLSATRWHYVIYEAGNITWVSNKYLNLLMQYKWFFPLTILNNLEYLHEKGIIETIPSFKSLSIVKKLFRQDLIDGFLKKLVTDGHETSYIYKVAGSAYGIIEYLIAKRSMKTNVPLWNIFNEYLISAGITKNYIDPEHRLYNKKSLDYLGKEHLNAIATPRRILYVTHVPDGNIQE